MNPISFTFKACGACLYVELPDESDTGLIVAAMSQAIALLSITLFSDERAIEFVDLLRSRLHAAVKEADQ
jgi:hypothetical protein